MEVSNSADIYEDTGLKDLLYELELKAFFKNREYGNNEVKLFFVVNCLKFDVKNRIRFSSKERVLYWDVILDYDLVKRSSEEEKKVILANSIIDSFDVIDKYKKLNLNKEAIKGDAKKYFISLGWLGNG